MSFIKMRKHHKLLAACCSDRGKARGNNEDNIYFDGKYLEAECIGTDGVLCASYNVPLKTDSSGILFAVFDGIGGSQGGEYASYIAARTADAYYSMILDAVAGDDNNLITSSLDMLYEDMNLAVFHGSRELNTLDMGTTAVSLFFYAGRAWCSNVGDSRCYLLRNGELSRISEDHTTAEAMAALGFTGFKPQLTQYVGMDPDDGRIAVSQRDLPFAAGDVFLLCSDGLTDMVKEDHIRDILSGKKDPETCAALLTNAALKNGGLDNITVIVIRI